MPGAEVGQAAQPGGAQPLDPLATEARSLALSHRAAAGGRRRVLPRGGPSPLRRLPQQEALLRQGRRFFAEAAQREEAAPPPIAVWLLDNYYVLLQTFRQIRTDMPAGFYRVLPRLAAGELRGLPRVYALAAEVLRRSRAAVDLQEIRQFLRLYQETTPLDMAELWAFPVMLRFTCLEYLVQAVCRAVGRSGGPACPQADPFPGVPPAPAEPLTDEETAANGILGLRALANEDWQAFFEANSLVERVLRQDPAGVYGRMDFRTRDRYRAAVERLARRAGAREEEVARRAVDLARLAAGTPDRGAGRRSHVGYYLIDAGLGELEAGLGRLIPPIARAARRIFRFGADATRDRQAEPSSRREPAAPYLGSIGLLTLLIGCGWGVYAAAAGGTPAQVLAAALLSLIPAVTVAVDLVNHLVTRLVPPRLLPKMDFSLGIPDRCRSAVVVPALVSHPRDAAALLERLELHSLRNQDPNLCFGLLTDFADAPRPRMPEDEELVRLVREGVRALNRKYAGRPAGPFFLFHRYRQWNGREGCWMGWERKRGKLHELNRLILGHGPLSPFLFEGDAGLLPTVRYVITLDADTVLPPGSASRLIGALAHPLNQAEFHPRTGRVAAGYTILQPRTEVQPEAAGHSPFTRIFAGEPALDLYTLAASDVYQDLFGEGIFVGKGIYDVAAFERSLEGKVPENSLLSHDLFEGIQGRAGLASDIVLLEDFPPTYLALALRAHRWVRGDWQLLPWLLRRYGGRRKPGAGRLSSIDRWKIVDNLRRSLVKPALLALLAAGWFWLPGSPPAWTLFAALSLAVPAVIRLADVPARLLKGSPPPAALRPVGNAALRALLALVFLPYEALIDLHAIGITLVRVLLTRRHLLLWTASARIRSMFGEGQSRAESWKQMAPAATVAALFLALLVRFHPQALTAASPLLLAWLLAPEIAYRISRPAHRRPAALPADRLRKLRVLARRSWLYFERFVDPENRWLPPDHFQEHPRGTVAHRTSPTNIGLMLLSALGAYDFGYLGPLSLSLRLKNTFQSLAELERSRGHLFNWYDTRTLAPLSPRYISTVDSGNLGACLLALRQGILELPGGLFPHPRQREGLLDALSLLQRTLERVRYRGELAPYLDPIGRGLEAMLGRLQAARPGAERGAESRAEDRPEGRAEDWAEDWAALLEALEDRDWMELQRRLMRLAREQAGLLEPAFIHQLRLYAELVHQALTAPLREIDTLLPWVRLFSRAPAWLGRRNAGTAEAWQALRRALPGAVPLGRLPAACETGLARLAALRASLQGRGGPEGQGDPGAAPGGADTGGAAPADAAGEGAPLREALEWCGRLERALEAARRSGLRLLAELDESARKAEAWAGEMDFRFLFDPQRRVFHLGYNVDSERLDPNHYDLLASEARVASLLAIALGHVPESHWLQLSRPFTRADGVLALLSWSAGMFEYLMPLLLTRHRPGTLLYESCLAAVDRQIRYGREKGVPWGISESAFYLFDAQMGYQYQAFGVPGLGFKRGLEEDLVVSPYASLLALPLRPVEAVKNLEAFSELCMEGAYGLYESIDYTSARLPAGQDLALVRSFYAHHTGMIFLSLANFLHGEGMVRRFHADPRIRSVELLLDERPPDFPPVQRPHPEEAGGTLPAAPRQEAAARTVPVQAPFPQALLLSNGRYGVLLTSAGSGASFWHEVDLTRWRADATLDDWGTWIYLLDRETGALWSAGYQPTGIASPAQEALFSPYHAEFRRRDHDISLVLEVTVPPAQEAEIRRLTLTNHSGATRRLRIASYGEPVLAPRADDERHSAFNKLFIESRFLADLNALLFRRRPRSARDAPVYLLHQLVPGDGQEATGAFETDRRAFLGRGGSARAPRALSARGGSAGLSGSEGATLDPVMVLGQDVEIPPNGTARLAFVTAGAASEPEARAIARRFLARGQLDRAFQQARLRSEREIQQRGLSSEEIATFQRLLSALLYPGGPLRAEPSVLAANTLGQPGLWRFAVSGDHPILLARFHSLQELPLAQELLRAHAWLRRRGIRIDLVLLSLQENGYSHELADALRRAASHGVNGAWIGRRGGIFPLSAEAMSEAERVLLETAARVVLDGSRGPLAGQLRPLDEQPRRLPAFTPTLPPDGLTAEAPPPGGEPAEAVPPAAGSPESGPQEEAVGGAAEAPAEAAAAPPRGGKLQFDNGLGGFTPDGREYRIRLPPGRWTPAPWGNVVANPLLGFLVTEAGGGYTWALNSGENRLTPWSNDPVCDRPGEALYLRDEETGAVWSPTPLPAGPPVAWEVRHGAGYSVFRSFSHGLDQELELFADREAPVKIVRLVLSNRLARPRRITATFYAEWVLGSVRERAQPYILPEYNREDRALLATNPYSVDFAGRFAFVSTSEPIHGLTTDRTEFLGRMGSPAAPAALGRIGLSNTVRPGLDPCAAVQVHISLQPGETRPLHFLLGQGADRAEALELIRRFREPAAAQAARQESRRYWERLLTAVQVRTPEPAMDLLLNRWLLYQDLSCRFLGRSGLYQSSGAFGFRDQLQDAMAFAHALPEAMRAHILEAARRQFEAGDVLHWWHPPGGRGVRTRVSDDLLWLPFVTAFYVEATGDRAILTEKVPFLRGEPLRPDEEERYGLYASTPESYTLYEHCRRAFSRAGARGRHGLPLIGTGDWNDGMNRVGIEGQGESVWLAWFLIACLTRFAPLCALMGEAGQGEEYRRQAEELRGALEASAWDGAWYRRAWYDDGSPLGSAADRECRIDSVAQSWAVLSGAGDPGRARQAMESAAGQLIRPEDRLILLFTPPFDGTGRDPGYIQGYPPGVRENGGQYTHAALWMAWAFTSLGQGDRAASLFRLINPIHHGDTPAKVLRYRVEPYVVAADVYSAPPYIGRGGWSWYTGSAGWMYRLGLEAILGIRRRGRALSIDPCIPSAWPGFEVAYRYGSAVYRIRVENPQGVCRGVRQVAVDGRRIGRRRVPLRDDGAEHRVEVRLGRAGR